jgi:hypothetical protein
MSSVHIHGSGWWLSSEFALGRREVRRRLEAKGTVTVSAYAMPGDRIRYAGPCTHPVKKRNKVLYRVRITLKRISQCPAST